MSKAAVGKGLMGLIFTEGRSLNYRHANLPRMGIARSLWETDYTLETTIGA